MHSFAILEAARTLCRLCGQTMGTGRTPPPSTAQLQADLCTAHITIWRGHTHPCTSTFEHLSMLILEAPILPGCVNKMRLYIINVITNLLPIMMKNQVLTSEIWLEAQQELMVNDDGKEATVFQVYPTQSQALDGPRGALTPCLQLLSRVRKCRPLCRSELKSLGGSQQGWTFH